MENLLETNAEKQIKEIKEVGKELKEIKQELKALNQNLGAITKMFKDYLVHEGVYAGPGGMFNNSRR